MLPAPSAVTDALVRKVLTEYGITDVHSLGRTDAGVTNENRVVQDTSGRQHFLRCWTWAPGLERIRFQLAFQEYLLSAGYPTARPIRSRTGADVIESGGLPWVLFEYVEGHEYDFDDIHQAGLAGEMLARFHRVAEGFQMETVEVPGESFAEFLSGAPGEPAALRSLFGSKGLDVDVDFAAAWWGWFYERWPPERRARLPVSWVHYDYHGRNVLFHDGHFAGLFDFDSLGWGTRAIDIARGLFNFARSGRGPIQGEMDANAARPLRPAFAHAFLDGYERELHIEPEELNSLPAMAAWNFAPSAYWYTRPYFAGRDLAPRFRRDLLLLRVVDAEMGRLAPEFGWEAR